MAMSKTDFNDILNLLQQRANRPLSLREIQETLDLSAGERKVIGRDGRTANAMRNLLFAAGMKIHKRVALEILDQ